MKPETVIFIGGIYNIAFVIFHLTFWKLFRWKADLRSLSFINRAVMQILNLCLTFSFVIFAYISIFHNLEMLSTGIGKSLLFLISLFWFFRAIEQIVFFGLKKAASVAFFVIFVIGTLIYLYPFINTINK
ncbi:MAG: hypothetical protein GY940_26060 [bacterium]|nr:hypothetical protein [bacterium]